MVRMQMVRMQMGRNPDRREKMQKEYVRNLQNNYERILLDEEPREQRYQYCILSRGGIKGLLPFGLRRINQQVYLYYDITSKQCVGQLFSEKPITREWMRDFIWSLKRIGQELDRFLLSDSNILWFPDQIYQDLEKNLFYFLYIPYWNQDNGFLKLLEFMVEHVDYEDEPLVELVYKMYESYEKNGEAYLREKIFEDFQSYSDQISGEKHVPKEKPEESDPSYEVGRDIEHDEWTYGNPIKRNPTERNSTERNPTERKSQPPKKKLWGFWENRRNKEQQLRKEYSRNMQALMRGEMLPTNQMVAEKEEFYGQEESYGQEDYGQEDYGNTIYIEEKKPDLPHVYKLYTPEGRVLGVVDQNAVTIGKRKDEVTVCIEDLSVSRLHARITRQNDIFYLEDLNSTNGTYKNGLQLRPYEKRQLEPEDEIKIGKKIMIFR